MRPVDTDIEDVLDDIQSVLYERETGRNQSYRSEIRQTEDIVYLMPGAWQNISDSLLALHQSLIPLDDTGVTGEPAAPIGRFGAFKGLVKRIIRKSVYWYVNPVVAQLHSVHRSTDRALHEIADQLRSINNRLEVLERENLDSRVGTLEGERFDERIGRLERSWRHSFATSAETVGTQTDDGGELPCDESLPVSEARIRGVGKDRSVRRDSRSVVPPIHFDYYWFESIHRGDRALIMRRQQPYLEYFSGCQNVLDIGCGRGEFLELMAEKRIGGYGIDLESDAIQYCKDAGLKVEQAEAIDHLVDLPDESLDGVYISQVAEHMTPSELIELIGLTYLKMKPKSYVVVETPNPQCLLIFASFFFADLSHVQPIHPETLRFLLLSAGFRDVEIKLTNPVPRNQRLSRLAVPAGESDTSWVEELNSNFEKLNSVLFGYMDYAAVARK